MVERVRAGVLLCVLHASVVVAFSPGPTFAVSPTRFALRGNLAGSRAPNVCMALDSDRAAVSRRESLFAAGALYFALPLSASADTFEEFMAKKQKKERQEQIAKQGGAAGGVDDEDDDVTPVTAAGGDDVEEDGEVRPTLSETSTFDEYKDVKPVKDTDPLKTALVTVIRVQESTLQEARLINTGNFKDLQRNNIKMATKMMVENTKINDVITKASAYADPSKVQAATERGRAAVQDLQVILDYFDEVDKEVKVSDLSKDKKEFIQKALKSAREKLDEFLAYMPKEKVKAARDQVILENELNKKELPKDLEILNPVFMN